MPAPGSGWVTESLAGHPERNLIARIFQDMEKILAGAATLAVKLRHVVAIPVHGGKKPAVARQVLRRFHLRAAERSKTACQLVNQFPTQRGIALARRIPHVDQI